MKSSSNFLLDVFDLPKSSIIIMRGQTSRIKHVEIKGLTEEAVAKLSVPAKSPF